MLLQNDLSLLVILIPIIIISLVIHELAHAWTATWLGDDTPKNMGRLTLNPLAHLDPLGTVFILLAGFGWAKPVISDTSKMKNPKFGFSLVALAGPVSNFILALLVMPFLFSVLSTGVSQESYLFKILLYTVVINLGLGVFNLMPFPPLDGSHLVMNLLPKRWEHLRPRIYQIGALVLFGILILNNTLKIDILPIGNIVLGIVQFFQRIYLGY